MNHSTFSMGVLLLTVNFTACKKISDGRTERLAPQLATVSAPLPAPVDSSSDLEPSVDEPDDELSLTTAECKDNANLSKITFSPSGELFINDPIVLNNERAKSGGKWSFSYAMREILELPAPSTSPELLAVEDGQVKRFIKKVTGDEIVNTFSTTTRTVTEQNLNSTWGTTIGTDNKAYLTFDKAPFKLIGIVNRLDIVKKGKISRVAGEGRFVYGFTGGQSMTVILEYDLPIGSASPEKLTQARWTKKWHGLKNFLVDNDPVKKGVQPDGSFPALLKFRDRENYLRTLQSITERFANRKARIHAGNLTQASISQIRTNELSSDWSLREMQRTYNASGKAFLQLTTVKNAPDSSFAEGQKGFKAWIESNVVCKDPKNRNTCEYKTADALLPNTILNGAATVPLVGARDVVTFNWFPLSQNTKQRFVALNTCGGCHQGETNTSFLHVNPFSAEPSAFLVSEIKLPRTKNFKNLICLGAADAKGLSLSDDEDASEKKLDLRTDFTFGVH